MISLEGIACALDDIAEIRYHGLAAALDRLPDPSNPDGSLSPIPYVFLWKEFPMNHGDATLPLPRGQRAAEVDGVWGKR